MPRPRRRLPSNRFWFWTGVAILAALRLLTMSDGGRYRDFSVPALHDGPCRVVRVLHGDTLVIVQSPSSNEVTVRLLGVQAPNPAVDGVKFAEMARTFTAAYLEEGEVRLVLDNHRLDHDGCYLAYVECGGEQLNCDLLAAGWARYCKVPGNSASLDRQLREAASFAQVERLGMWRQ